ncbi:MAG: hypothetical protein BGO95_09335 [Micrococcales bacterium 73-13]|nr:MAG: hypothetical protein BGO95_09335 [Micrococcales bacterium 73-13]
MADLSDLIESIPIGDIAKQLGVPESEAASAVAQAVPTILAGMQANVDDGGAGSLEAALGKHEGKLTGKVGLDDIDTADGRKIVQNVLGGNADAVAAKVADANPSSFVSKDLIMKILPIVAPIVIAFLANKFLGKKQESVVPQAQQESSGGLGDLVGDVLGGLTGGGQAASGGAAASGGGIGDLIGGILGGGGGLGGLLGGGAQSGGGGGFDLGGLLGGLGGLLGGGTK